MPLPVSKSQVDSLGKRLRAAASPDPDDLTLLQAVVQAHQASQEEVVDSLRSLGYQPTSRLKTWQTIVEKLQREKARLSQIQDIAGARLTVDGGRYEQDRVGAAIQQRWPGARLADRRRDPSFGYRAVHLIVSAQGCLVEIQVRTRLQNQWAQVTERLADRYGRAIRYGKPPSGGNDAVANLVKTLLETANKIAEYETAEDVVKRYDDISGIVTPSIAVMPDGRNIDEAVDAVRDYLASVRATMSQLEELLAVHYFLLMYDRRRGVILEETEFDAASDALAERFERERSTGFDQAIEVVVLGAESHDALVATHARYFQSTGELLSSHG